MSPDSFEPQRETALQRLVDLDAEEHLIGNVLAQSKCFDSVAWMKPEFFGLQVHGEIWAAMKTLRAQGREFGPAYLTEFFADDPAIKAAGGQEYLHRLAVEAFSPSSVKDLAAHILSLHYRRVLLTLGGAAQGIAKSPDFYEPPEKVLGDFELVLAQARGLAVKDGFVTAASSAEGALKSALNPIYGIGSGFSYLHKITGGFKPSELITIAGRPGMGKTAMGLTLAVNAALGGRQVLFFSLEMDENQLMQRVLSRFSQQAVHSGEITDQEAAEKAVLKAQALPLTIEPSGGSTALEIAAKAAQYKRRYGLDIVFVDYLGLIKPQDTRMQKVHQIEEATQGMKNMAKALKVPVVLLCQLSRAVEGREDKRPGLSDLRDSGSIEQDSDVVMFIYREDYYAKKNELPGKFKTKNREAADMADEEAAKDRAELIVAKNRQNVLDTVYLKFSGREQVFYE